MVALAREKQVKAVFVPAADAMEAALVQEVTIYPVETLGHLVAHLNGERLIEPYIADPRLLDNAETDVYAQDMAAVRGQEHVKRALEVAASGGCGIPELVTVVLSLVSLTTLFPLTSALLFPKFVSPFPGALLLSGLKSRN